MGRHRLHRSAVHEPARGSSSPARPRRRPAPSGATSSSRSARDDRRRRSRCSGRSPRWASRCSRSFATSTSTSGAGALGGTSHLYHLATTPELRPLVDGRYDGPLYTGDFRAPVRDYRCHDCGPSAASAAASLADRRGARSASRASAAAAAPSRRYRAAPRSRGRPAVDLGRRVDDARAEPDGAAGVGRHAGDDAAALESGDDVLRVETLDVEAHEAGGQRLSSGSAGHRARRQDPALSREASACTRAATRPRPIARWKRNASASAQRCSKEWKPPGVSAARRGGRPGRTAAEPGAVARAVLEGGDHRPQRLGKRAARPEEPGAARAVEPLVAAGDERVAPRAPGGPASSTPTPCTPSTHSSTRSGASADLPQRQLHAGARVHPGERDDARARRRRRGAVGRSRRPSSAPGRRRAARGAPERRGSRSASWVA